MKVRIFGRDLFESKWVPRPRGWLNHKFLCDGQVAVHEAWLDKGYNYAALYDHTVHNRAAIMDWCQEHTPNDYIIHPSGAILFKSLETAEQFHTDWS